MKKILSSLLILALPIIVLTACKAETAAIENITWVLLWYGEQGRNLQAVLEGTEITATFDSEDGEVTGSAGCNTYYGDYQVRKNELSISPLAWTEMACLEPEGVMEQEQQYLSALQAAESYTIEDGELLVWSSGGRILVFHAK